jgi:DNA helicase HerA-like ATPase
MIKNPLENEIIGYILYDEQFTKLTPTSCYAIITKEIELKRGTYVRIGDLKSKSYYIGQLIDGPYHIPIREETKINFKPNDINMLNKPYSIVYVIELTSFIESDIQTAVLSRPAPGTPIRLLDAKILQNFLGSSEDLILGRLPNQKDVLIGLDASVLTRHLGIFGTTGSGKSNTLQVLLEEASENGFAILVFDVEGEYIKLDEPTDKLLDLLKEFNKSPKGINDFKVYVPAPSNTLRHDAIRFGINFAEMNKEVFSEVAELTKIEEMYFFDLIKKVEEIAPAFRKVTLKAVIERLRKRLEAQVDNPTLPEFIAEAHTSLYSKLALIERLGIMDAEYPPINIESIMVPGRVSIIDLSDTSDAVKNITIAELLDKIFRYKINNPNTPKILILLEEAHTFISREKRDRMLATLMLLIELARRGRKRGICLGVVTQQPSHLPSELLELCNTRIIHRLSSTSNIQVLRESTGNVPDALWDTLPSLGKGESIIASPKFNRALIAQIRPAKSKRLAAER